MKTTLRTLSLIAALSGMATASQAATVVWSQNFDSLALGTYGTATDFAGNSPANNIVTSGSGQAMALTFNATSGSAINLQVATPTYAASGNTSLSLGDYTLEFDLAVEGIDFVWGFGGLEISVQNGGGIFGQGVKTPFYTTTPTAGSGFQHISLNLGTLNATAGGFLNPTDAALAFGIGVINFGNGMTVSPETILVDNVQISMVAVPEPGTGALLIGGLGLLAGWRRRVS